MKGLTFKTTAIAFALSSTMFSSLLTFAANTDNHPNQSKMYSSKLGCMTCHQGESMQPDKAREKKNDLKHRQNQKP